MKILITGISGFIGNSIASSLSKKHTIYGIYRNKKPKIKNKNNVILIKGDLINPKEMPIKCDYIIHAASETPNRTKDDSKIYNSNTISMKNLITYSIKSKPKYFLFLSSNSIYGTNKQKIINEKSKSIKPNKYGLSKIHCEKLLETFSKKQIGTKCLSIRLPGVVGINSKDNFISNTLKNIRNKKDVSIYNKTALFNNIVHVDDIVKYTLIWIKHQKSNYDMFNVAASYPISLDSVTDIFFKLQKNTVKVHSNYKGKKPFIIDTSLARKNKFNIRKTKDILIDYAKKEIFK